MSQSIQKALRGCLELPVFLAQGVDRFENTQKAFYQSWIVVLLLIPLTVPIEMLDPVNAGLDFRKVFILVAYRSLVSSVFFLGGVWLLCWPLQRLEHFYRFGNACNWLSISVFVLFLPYAMLLAAGIFTMDQMSVYLFFVVCYSTAFTAFMTKHALKVGGVAATLIALGTILAVLLTRATLS